MLPFRDGSWRRAVAELAAEGVAAFKLYLLSGMETYRDLAPAEVRARAAEPEFLGFVLDFLLQSDAFVLDFAAEAGVSLPLTAAVQQMFNQLRANGYGDEDNSALLRVAEAAANSQI